MLGLRLGVEVHSSPRFNLKSLTRVVRPISLLFEVELLYSEPVAGWFVDS